MDETTTIEVKAQAGRKGVWRISMDAEALTFSALDGNESFQIPRTEAEEKTELHDPRFLTPFLVVHILKKRVVFELDKAQVESLREWLGPPTALGLKIALKKRLRWCLPIGILFVVTSIPLPADPEAGLEGAPFNAVSAFLGVSLIGLCVVTRIWPRRVFFLLDALWFSLLAVDSAFGIYRGDSWWWSILVVVLILSAGNGVAMYRRFASVSYQEVAGKPSEPPYWANGDKSP